MLRLCPLARMYLFLVSENHLRFALLMDLALAPLRLRRP